MFNKKERESALHTDRLHHRRRHVRVYAQTLHDLQRARRVPVHALFARPCPPRLDTPGRCHFTRCRGTDSVYTTHCVVNMELLDVTIEAEVL